MCLPVESGAEEGDLTRYPFFFSGKGNTNPPYSPTKKYQDKPTYNYTQNICNLKYVPPKTKTTFSLAYKKPIAKVYVYNNYIQNLDNCNKGPYYEKKDCCIPSTTKATYKCT